MIYLHQGPWPELWALPVCGAGGRASAPRGCSSYRTHRLCPARGPCENLEVWVFQGQALIWPGSLQAWAPLGPEGLQYPGEGGGRQVVSKAPGTGPGGRHAGPADPSQPIPLLCDLASADLRPLNHHLQPLLISRHRGQEGFRAWTEPGEDSSSIRGQAFRGPLRPAWLRSCCKGTLQGESHRGRTSDPGWVAAPRVVGRGSTWACPCLDLALVGAAMPTLPWFWGCPWPGLSGQCWAWREGQAGDRSQLTVLQ